MRTSGFEKEEGANGYGAFAAPVEAECGRQSERARARETAIFPETKPEAPRGGLRFGEEEGRSRYGVFAALTETAETEWRCVLLTMWSE